MKKVILMLILLVFFGSVFSPVCAGQDKKDSVDAKVKQMAAFKYVCFECKGPYAQFLEKEKAFLKEFNKSGIKAAGPEISVYWNSPLFVKPENLLWDIGYQVKGDVKAKGNLKVKEFSFKKVAAAVHVGSYLTTYKTVDALYKWIAEKKHTLAEGPCVERYLDPNPEKVSDSKKKTEILIPLK